MGNVQVAHASLAGGLKSYEKSRVIAEKLASPDRSNAGWQRDLAWMVERIAGLERL